MLEACKNILSAALIADCLWMQ